MSVRPQAASFGPEPRSRPFVILDVEHYASGYKRTCGLAQNQKLPPVAGHSEVNPNGIFEEDVVFLYDWEVSLYGEGNAILEKRVF